MEGEEVDWAYYDIIVEITKPSHSKEIIDMTIDGSTLVFNYKPNQCGQYIATAYLNRYKPDEAALDVKIFEGVRWSWCADNDDDEITTFNLSGNISYGSVNLNNYYTKQEIDEKLEDIAVGDVDLTNYATKEWVGNKYQPKGNYQPAGNYLTSIPSEYVTETELETRLEGISSGSGTSDTIPTLTINIENGNYNNISLVPTVFTRLENDKLCHIVVYSPENNDDETFKNSYVNVTNYQFMTVQSNHDTLTIWVDIIGDGYYMVQMFRDTSKYKTAFISKYSESWTNSIKSLETRIKALEDAINQ